MSLDDKLDGKLRSGSLSRRDFLRLGGLGLASLALGGRCKSPVSPEESDFVVDPHFSVFNHLSGKIGDYGLKGVMTGSEVNIKVDDLGVGGVDSKRIVVRGPLNDCVFLGFGRDGSVSFRVDKLHQRWGFDYGLFLMDGGVPGSEYDKIDYWVDQGGNSGTLRYGHEVLWKREDKDGVTGPDEPLLDAVGQLDGSLGRGWVHYGDFTKVGSGADFGIGYGRCSGYPAIHSSTQNWAGVNPEMVTGYGGRKALFLEEIFELMNRVADLGGVNTNKTITDSSTGDLNSVGKALNCYVHVKDSQTF